ncbi:MAG: glycine cleavage system protein GcvH [Gemmatimonadetes bacterium]|uniref:Glycine cleavage system H protein n=1 Tax=Candidatus Kutchimonas denitrificans TaxID=3056748 RepID=A0AAE4Z949_9BACT|nr:glycine cleavage system protein GcvH [Gemmatimonadota bacterium]NIR75313.1 glycine cleavage system protein GcvH [Candidatus Kutchimonas denitrificans]NIS02139.1 glycine cleavage system protein GcvH [Gemmatimonadota bacterium]NIT67964.1 glycine cleavage system protein GcvH [Gemmatimonadota bacterium]NIU53958.1 glycine cleavage system protein GcvH [Gemmatimonadota bacterium]
MAEANVPKELLYTEEHEWVEKTGDDEIKVGITDYAQGELSDVVFVELPDVGASFSRMEAFGTIEAVKAVSELYSPAAGEVTEVNDKLADDPAAVNRDPYGDGWMIKLKLQDPSELDSLLSPEGYSELIAD